MPFFQTPAIEIAIRVLPLLRRAQIVTGRKMVAGCGQNRTASSADSWVHHHDMHRVLGEVAVGLGDGDGAVEKIKAVHAIGYVHDSGAWLDTANNPFHRTNIVLSRPEVGGKSNHPLY